MDRPRSSLRVRLAGVALLAVLPVLGGLFLAHRQFVASGRDEATAVVRELARITARAHRDALRDAEVVLGVIGAVAASESGVAAGCARLPQAYEGHGFYSALALYHADGSIICRYPAGEGYDLSAVPYFVQAVESGTTAFADYHVTPAPEQVARASLAVPATVDGAVSLVAVAGIDLVRVRSLQETVAARPGLSLVALEPDGTVLLRLPDVGAVVGTRVEAALAEAGADTIVTAPDASGVERRYAVRSLGLEDPRLETRVAVGFELRTIQGLLLPGSFVGLLGLLLGGVVMLGGIWLVLEYGFLRRITPVLDAARAFGEGRLDARSGLRGDDEAGLIAGTFDDMAEQVERLRKAEAEAARREIQDRDDRFRLVAETIDEAFWIWDAQLARRIYVSPGFEKIWGRPADEIMDARGSWAETIHPDDRSDLPGGPQPGTREYRILRPDDSERWVRNRTFAVSGPDGTVRRYVGTVQDITERRMLEEALTQTSKLEAVGRLAGGVAHDFNNILMAVRGHVQLLQDAVPPSSELQHDLTEIDRAAGRAERLTGQLLAFGRRQPLLVRTFDLADAVLDMQALLRRIVGERIDLTVAAEPDTPPVRMDPTHLEQILVNLAANARDAMEEGGRLDIRISRGKLPEAAPELAESASEGFYARLEVTDDGVGMERGVLAHVFEPFFTTKDTGKGTGLGLATVYGVTTQAGGHIRVWSEPGRGARFTIFLPAAPLANTGSARVEAATQARPESSSEPGRILLVEDESAVRAVIRRALLALGHEVVAVESAAQALAEVESHTFDLVLTDIAMPDMSGPELVRALRTRNVRTPVIYMSGYPGDAVDEGPILQKPFSHSVLARTIDTVLADR